MNPILLFVIEIVLTLILAALLVGYLRPFLRSILTDLCGTPERAQFWTAFSNILILGLPMIFALNYHPEARDGQELFFELAGKLSGNLAGLLFALICIGFIVSIFALVAPRQKNMETK